MRLISQAGSNLAPPGRLHVGFLSDLGLSVMELTVLRSFSAASYGLDDQGEYNEQRLTVGGLAEGVDHAIKSDRAAPARMKVRKACVLSLRLLRSNQRVSAHA
jgi:hypothetical protein